MFKHLSFVLSFAVAMSSVAGIASADRAYAPAKRAAPAAPAAGMPAPSSRFAQPPPADEDEALDPDVRAPDAILDRATVRAALVKRRAQSLAAFRAYRARGVFPSNVYKDSELNVWRDRGGHFCAAATIIRTSGQVALVDRVADQNNFIRLAEVETGPLMDWMLTSGLTQEELALIQRPFMPVVKAPPAPSSATVAVDAKLRATETARLAKLYATVDRTISAQTARSLETATDRLMKHHSLAWQLIVS